MDTLALPYYGWRLRAVKPRPGYPSELVHVGDHIRKRRIDLRLTRNDLAKRLGTNGWTIKHWEEHLKLRIELRFFPRIVAFLGYNPLPPPRTRGEAIKRERTARGWSLKRFAKESGVDEATARRVELNQPGVSKRASEAVLRALQLSADLQRPAKPAPEKKKGGGNQR